jgi:Protein of unknown function (DUF1360)
MAQLASLDDGPFGAFRRLRAWAGAQPNDTIRENLGPLLHCPYCVGIWAAVPCALMMLWPSDAGDLALMIFGLAGGQAWLQGPRDAAEV